MKKMLFPVVLAMASSSVFADNFKFSTTKLNYQVPQKVVNACAKKIKQAKAHDNPKTTCMNVNIDLLTSNYSWVNQIVNSNYHNIPRVTQNFNQTANEVYHELQEDFHYQRYENLSELQQLSISPRLLQIVSNDYEYSGGAHGMPTRSLYVFDIKQKKLLKVDDILTHAQQKKSLEKLAIHAFKQTLIQKYREIDEPFTEQDWQNYLESWEFELNDNFYFTPTGLNFSYNPYALGGYALGFFTLKINKKDLVGIIKPEYLNQNLQAFNPKAVDD